MRPGSATTESVALAVRKRQTSQPQRHQDTKPVTKVFLKGTLLTGIPSDEFWVTRRWSAISMTRVVTQQGVFLCDDLCVFMSSWFKTRRYGVSTTLPKFLRSWIWRWAAGASLNGKLRSTTGLNRKERKEREEEIFWSRYAKDPLRCLCDLGGLSGSSAPSAGHNFTGGRHTLSSHSGRALKDSPTTARPCHHEWAVGWASPP
jgi:hypothetical protein